jgi:hypothetical protein
MMLRRQPKGMNFQTHSSFCRAQELPPSVPNEISAFGLVGISRKISNGGMCCRSSSFIIQEEQAVLKVLHR